MDNKKYKLPKSSFELRKIAVVILRLAVISLVATIIGVMMDLFHWYWILIGIATLFSGYVVDVVLNAIADMSEKIDRLVDFDDRTEKQ